MGPRLLSPLWSDGRAVDSHPPVIQNPPSHHIERCITCNPGDHPRQWTHPPAGSPPRHIVLCFDGTRDLFGKDPKEAHHTRIDRTGDNICFFGLPRGAIKFIGIWYVVHLSFDIYFMSSRRGAVNSVGLIEGTLPFADKNTTISFFLHAMSLDGHHVKFRISTRYSSPASAMVCSSQFVYQGLPFTVTLSEVGGGSVRNGKPNSLARTPPRPWMIRECFKVIPGLIFDTCMLKHEAGLDMDQEMGKDIGPTLSPPDPLLPSGDNSALARPEKGKSDGHPPWSTPAAIWSGLRSPFRWAGNKLHNLYRHYFCESTDITPQSEQKDRPKGEAHEEHNDALSPIVDRVKIDPL